MSLHLNAPACNAAGCDRTDRVGQPGYCHKHYERLRRTGTTDRHIPTLMERIEPKIARTETGCWEWRAYLNPTGYGQVGIGRRVFLAHRAVYEALVGPIKPGLTIDHLCKNPPCVNPAHMEPVTMAENIRRADYSKNGEHLRRRTHCPRGHSYDSANTYITHAGTRMCRACHREKARERYVAVAR